MIRSYEEMLTFPSFEERLAYLQLFDTNALSPRHMSEEFYKSQPWLYVRKKVIERDMGFDLAVFGVYIPDIVMVHHINPITEEDIINLSPKLFDMNNLVTTSKTTHNKIHYKQKEKEVWVERQPGDTILW